MSLVVADTSALVSLGTVTGYETDPLSTLLDQHRVVVPRRVLAELRETSQYDDASGERARAILDRRSALDVQETNPDETFPLDDGENAAVTVANDIDASQLLCDEFNSLAVVHASLADTRLVTTPSFVLALVRKELLPASVAENIVAEMSNARSWESNAYVERAMDTLERENQR